MKKLLLLLFTFVMAFSQAEAQIEKGRSLIDFGGALGIANLEGGTTFQLGLDATGTRLISNNFALGGNFAFTIIAGQGTTRYFFGVGPAFQYYIPLQDRFYLFFGEWLRIGYTGGGSGRFSVFNRVGPGIAVFLNDNVGINLSLNYEMSKVQDFLLTHSIFTRIGFQIILGKGKGRLIGEGDDGELY